MPRPRTASARFVAGLPDTLREQLLPVFSPLIEIVALEQNYALSHQDSAVFSSRNAVQTGPEGDGRTAYCIGPATTEAAMEKGWAAQQIGQDADSLVAKLTRIAPKGRLLHLSGAHTRGDIAGRLSAAGLNIERSVAYDQTLHPLSQEAQNVILTAPRGLVPLFSPRTAAQFVLSTPGFASVHVIALSPAVAHNLGSKPVSGLTIAARPDAQAMGAALQEALARN